MVVPINAICDGQKDFDNTKKGNALTFNRLHYDGTHGNDSKQVPALPGTSQIMSCPELYQPVTKSKFVVSRKTNAKFHSLSIINQLSISFFTYDRQGLLIQQSKIDRAIRKVLPAALCTLLLCWSYCPYPVLAAQLEGRRLYATLCHEFHWLHISNDVYTVDSGFQFAPCKSLGTIVRNDLSCFQHLAC